MNDDDNLTFLLCVYQDIQHQFYKINESFENMLNLISKQQNITVKELKKREKKRLIELLNTNINELEFTIRTTNQLILNRIYTIADIVSKNEDYFLKLKNFGKKALNEIKNFLNEKGLKFNMQTELYYNFNIQLIHLEKNNMDEVRSE